MSAAWLATAFVLACFAGCERTEKATVVEAGSSAAAAFARVDVSPRPAAPPAAAPAISSPAPADSVALEKWNAELADALSKWLASRGGDADSALAEALLAPLLAADGSTREEIAERFETALGDAARLRPDDPDIAWLEAMRCPPASKNCDRASGLQRLMHLDPGNAAVWLEAAERALQDDYMAAFDEYLHLAAQSSDYHSRYGKGTELLAGILGSAPLPARSPQIDQALRKMAGLGPGPVLSDADLAIVLATIHDHSILDLPALGPMYRGCRLPLPASRRRDCTGAAVRMAEGDTLLAQLFGISKMVTLSAGTPANRHWRERLRQAQWMSSARTPRPVRAGPDYVRDLWQLGEVPALQTWLKANNHAMPPGWLPDDPRERDRITLGPSG